MKAAYIILTTLFEQEDAQYVSVCPELNVASCGDSIQEAGDNLQEAITLYLNQLEVDGTRDRIFSEKGIRTYRASVELPNEVQRTVPLDTMVKATRHLLPATAA